MEPPVRTDSESLQDEKVKVLRRGANGPALAYRENVRLAVPSPRPPWDRKVLWPLLHGLVGALFPLGLWLASYPTWRVLAVGALLCANWARILVFEPTVVPIPSSSDTPAPGEAPSTAAWLLGVASQFAVVGLTGGLRSPFVVAMLGPLSSMLVSFGWARETKVAVAIARAGAIALVVLPASWLGPQVPAPWFARLVGLTLFATILLHSSFLVALGRALMESRIRADRVRERMAQDGLARPRELEQLGAQLSHELKNPLGAIKALVQLSRNDARDDSTRERLLVAENEIDRMTVILHEYLSFSRPLDRLRRQELSLGALADEVLELLDAQASGAGIALLRSGDAVVEADPRRLREALFNLVANAIDAIARDGYVEVRIASLELAARIEVRDSGRGMPPEVLERVGTPFFTTREQGTGLGAAMARAAFAQHGGELSYSTEPGRGTTAIGILPFTREKDSRGAATPRR
jgi:signal transduction histidine kinase